MTITPRSYSVLTSSRVSAKRFESRVLRSSKAETFPQAILEMMRDGFRLVRAFDKTSSTQSKQLCQLMAEEH